MKNNTPFTEDEIRAMERIGFFKNNWRQRRVSIYQHPNYPDQVVAMGEPFDGSAPICTVEDKAAYKQYIGSFNKVVRIGQTEEQKKRRIK